MGVAAGEGAAGERSEPHLIRTDRDYHVPGSESRDDVGSSTVCDAERENPPLEGLTSGLHVRHRRAVVIQNRVTEDRDPGYQSTGRYDSLGELPERKALLPRRDLEHHGNGPRRGTDHAPPPNATERRRRSVSRPQ